MIRLRSDCLVFKTSSDQAIPCAVEDVAVQLVGNNLAPGDLEVLRNAAIAVLYFFKNEMGRESITVAEFTEALQQALDGFGFKFSDTKAENEKSVSIPPRIAESDLRFLACASGHGCDLLFFPLLRKELGDRLKDGPTVVRFTGLRGCVKQLRSARRWTAACQALSDQIVEYLRQCLAADSRRADCALVVR